MPKKFQLKIYLDGIKPQIWRRFLVPDNISFEELHEIIQDIMGWESYHLWEFRIKDISIVPPEDQGGFNLAESSFGKLFKSPDFLKILGEQGLSNGFKTLDTNKVNKIMKKIEKEKKTKEQFDIETSINKIVNKEGMKFLYIYDFGDSWKHTIVVEKINDDNGNQKVPICLEGERACPPEDCGGIWGYEELLKIKKDKNHPDYEERIVEWLGEDFDFEEFNLNEVNKIL